MESEGIAITRKAMEMALRGDLLALRLCLERIYPARKERLIDLPLAGIRTAQDTATAISTVLAAIGDGRLTPGEGQALAEIIDAKTRTIQAEDHDRRIAAIEQAVAENKRGQR